MIKICDEIDDKTDQKFLIEESFNDMMPEEKVDLTKDETLNGIESTISGLMNNIESKDKMLLESE